MFYQLMAEVRSDSESLNEKRNEETIDEFSKRVKTIASEISNLGQLIERLARMRENEIQTKS